MQPLFVRQQPTLRFEQEATAITRKTAEAAIARNNAMAGDDDRERVGTAGLADGAWRIAQVLRQFAVSVCPAAGMAAICSQTRRWNGVPEGFSGRPKMKSGSLR